jgi:hypothetical protein
VTSTGNRLVWAVYGLVGAFGIWGIVQYPGDRLVFCFFCLIVFAIAYFAVRNSTQYAHFFLGIAWFLGFWVKLLFHQATGAPYHELHGSFDGSNASWDAVLLVVGIGGAGYLVGRLVASPIVNPLTARLLKREIVIPLWWASYRNMLWLIAGMLTLSLVMANQEFGVLVRGHVAQIVLPWPLGGLFAWMTDIGLALLLSLLLAWDRQSGFGVFRGFFALCLEGALISVSTLSRGVYFFHTLPPLLTEGARKSRGVRLRPFVILFGIWFVIGIAIPSTITFLRLFGQNAVPTTQVDLTASETANINRPRSQSINILWNQFTTMTQLLLIDRWTGLEGVMATVAYPNKNNALLLEAAIQRRSYGTVDVYTKKISGSTFTEENAKKYHFATLAGPIAFLYFSGSLFAVFFGMALIAVVISAIEVLWLWLARDRLLVAMSGLYLALIVLQLSGGLMQSAAGVFAVTGAFGGIWLIGSLQQRNWFISKVASPGN